MHCIRWIPDEGEFLARWIEFRKSISQPRGLEDDFEHTTICFNEVKRGDEKGEHTFSNYQNRAQGEAQSQRSLFHMSLSGQPRPRLCKASLKRLERKNFIRHSHH